jgi:hypothetical protein
MNYRKIYLKIIKKAQSEDRQKTKTTDPNFIYYETHHILPKALFPLWRTKKSNLVLLTAREHFVCHLMLTKIYGKSMIFALWRLINNKQQQYVIKNSHTYEAIKKVFAVENGKLKSIQLKGFKHSEVSKQHMKEARQKQIITEKHKQSMSEGAKKRWADPAQREAQRQRKLEFYKTERSLISRKQQGEKHSVTMKNRYKNDPELRALLSKKIKEWWTKRKSILEHT